MPRILNRSALVLALCATPYVHAWDPGKDLKRAQQDIGKGLEHLKGEIEKEPKKILSDRANPKALSQDFPDGLKPGADTFWMAVIGDSSVTGAVASPSFRATWERVAQLVGSFIQGRRADPKMVARFDEYVEPARYNIENPPTPLTRVMFSSADYAAAKTKHELHLLDAESRGSQSVDTAEYAFPYLIGRSLQIPAPQIVLAGQDGKRIAQLGPQFDRILETGAPSLPPLALISFVANDLCHPDNFTNPLEHFTQKYQSDLKQQIEHVLTLPAHARGTKLVFVAPVKVSEILTNPELLDQPVKFENGDNVTCRQVHDGSGVHGDAAKKLQSMLIGACRGVLQQGPDAEAQRRRLDEMQDATIGFLNEAVDEINRRGHDLNFSAVLAMSPRRVQLRRGDLANDCFHPSIAGHARLANALLLELGDLRR